MVWHNGEQTLCLDILGPQFLVLLLAVFPLMNSVGSLSFSFLMCRVEKIIPALHG